MFLKEREMVEKIRKQIRESESKLNILMLLSIFLMLSGMLTNNDTFFLTGLGYMFLLKVLLFFGSEQVRHLVFATLYAIMFFIIRSS